MEFPDGGDCSDLSTDTGKFYSQLILSSCIFVEYFTCMDEGSVAELLKCRRWRFRLRPQR